MKSHGRLLAIPTESRQALHLREEGWRNQHEHDVGTLRPTLMTPSATADAEARAGCTDYAGDTPMYNNRAADFALSPPLTPTPPTASGTRGTKRPVLDAGGYERLDSDSSSDSGSGSESDDEACGSMAMITAGHKTTKRVRFDC